MNKLLMSAENPEGWKLEELLEKIASELEAKTVILRDKDPSDIATKMIRNNDCIVCRLRKSIGFQEDTLKLLDGLGVNQGPRGKPRI